MSDDDPDLDDAMRAAFRRSRDPAASVVERVGARPVSLPEEPDGTTPIVRPKSPEVASGREGRYQMLGEIARGGVGVVLRGHDVDLGRDVAMKILRDEHKRNPDVIQRFVEEAQIGGQLQHPGIVPVYEMGQRGDDCPFFTMKLIKGRTLADLLRDRKSPGDEHGRFLRIFEAVCQTMAYAHARRVIHRDLKPANVMTGSFGEVLVVDWGLGKVLGKGGIADERRALQSVIATVRTGSVGSESQIGSVMGTPSYMPPEQARGQIEQIDERSDVFSLGAILCEVLTGRPPYVGGDLVQAAKGDLADAYAALDACGADPGLVRLAKSCLVPAVISRPRNAGVLAAEVSAHLQSLDDRAKAAETAATEARVKAVEERKRRKLSLALSAAVVAFVVLGAGGWMFVEAQNRERRDETSQSVTKALDEATLLRGRAAGGADAALWREALTAAKAAESLAHSRDVDASLRAKAVDALAAATDGVAKAQATADQKVRDAALVAELDDIRERIGDAISLLEGDAAYADALRAYGIDVDAADETAVAKAVAASEASEAVVQTLDYWARILGIVVEQPESFTITADGVDRARERAARLVRIAKSADADPWRNGIRDATDLPALRALAERVDVNSLSPQDAIALSGAFQRLKDSAASIPILRQTVRRHPGHFVLNRRLGNILRPMSSTGRAGPDVNGAVRYLTAALALRPDSVGVRHGLGIALETVREYDEAIRVFRETVDLRPSDVHMRCHLAQSLGAAGRWDESRAVTRDLERVLRDGDATVDERCFAADVITRALLETGDLDAALVHARENVRADTARAASHLNLLRVLERRHEFVEARSECESLIRMEPAMARNHAYLGGLLLRSGDPDGAVAAAREALRLSPTGRTASHANAVLGRALLAKGDVDGALAAGREAVRIEPEFTDAQVSLGIALAAKGDVDGAVAAFRAAIARNPRCAEAHKELGAASARKGDVENALAELREAVRLDPRGAEFPSALARALVANGQFEEARDALQKSMDIAKGGGVADWFLVAIAEKRLGRADSAREWFDKAAAWTKEHDPINEELARFQRDAAETLGLPAEKPPTSDKPR